MSLTQFLLDYIICSCTKMYMDMDILIVLFVKRKRNGQPDLRVWMFQNIRNSTPGIRILVG